MFVTIEDLQPSPAHSRSAAAPGTGLTRTTTSRRNVLRVGGAAGIAGLIPVSVLSPAAATTPDSAGNADTTGDHQVFQHGVASGDPLPDAVLIWTRVTSHADDRPGAGVGKPVNLVWQVSSDDSFSDTLASGTVTSDPGADNTVKIDATGLPADTWMAYRFVVADGPYAGQAVIGYTRTAPPFGAATDYLGIALTSCANWEAGYFSAYRDMADDPDIDLVMCVGDYIYEYGTEEYAGKLGPIRVHQPTHEIISLADYRLRYGTYRTDPDLQAAHAAKPWAVTWDDHEVANDDWAMGAENHSPETEGDYIQRRNAALQAYLEWMPVRATALKDGGHLYRTLNFGNLAEIVMLDLRSYRDQAPEFKNIGDTDDESRTMLGSEQFSYLANRWTTSDAQWNLVGNSVMFTPVLIPPMDPEVTGAVTELLGLPEQGVPYNLDQWDGYAAERRRVINLMADKGLDNVIFLTGDIHSSWACDVPIQPATYPASGVAAAEFVCTSVSAPNIDDIVKLPQRNPISLAAEAGLGGANRHCRWIEFDHHGYAKITVTPDEVRADYRLVEDKALQNQPLYTAASYVKHRGENVRMI
ncbi:alkaline phosphatase D family protein [Corynebacterium sp. TAE3-ERU12]|nr:alkaline phosphatase D family protein [Corynebacterium sp. TAE3-ERU12]